MIFSVLLPTHNRLDLLQYAVESVRRQHYPHWELIISDNASEEDVAGYIHSLNDPRIKYSRTDHFISVTENWNRCLSYATGDYIIMLGDDDALMPEYFSTLLPLIQQNQYPDVVFTDAYIFAYPGVIPEKPEGYLQSNCHQIFEPFSSFVLEKTDATAMVKQWMAFELPAVFNMQFSLVKNTFIHKLASRGTFYQSLFPDYYATIAEFLMAENIFIHQYPLIIIGISPKSHGFFYFNKKMEEATSLLHDSFLKKELISINDILLPGDWILTGWLSAVKNIELNYPQELQKFNLQFNISAYRRKILVEVCKGYFRDKSISKAQFGEFKRKLGSYDWWLHGIRLSIYYSISGLLNLEIRQKLLSILKKPMSSAEENKATFTSILDVINYLEATTVIHEKR